MEYEIIDTLTGRRYHTSYRTRWLAEDVAAKLSREHNERAARDGEDQIDGRFIYQEVQS